MLRLIPLLLLVLGCVIKQPTPITPMKAVRPTELPPMPPTEATMEMSISRPAPPLMVMAYWDCGCGLPMPHTGHEFDFEYTTVLGAPWTVVRTNQPPVFLYGDTGYFRVGCHIGNP